MFLPWFTFFLLICTWQHEVAKHIDSQTIKIIDFGNSYMYRPQTPISNFCLGLLRKCCLSLSKKCPSLKPKSSWISLLSLDRFSLHGLFSNYFLWVIFFLSLKSGVCLNYYILHVWFSEVCYSHNCKLLLIVLHYHQAWTLSGYLYDIKTYVSISCVRIS